MMALSVLYLMIPISLLLGVGFLAGFIWATKKGQYEDLENPAIRILFENDSRVKDQISKKS